MRLTYKILWFEDTESSYNTLRSYVEEYLLENGFITEIKWYKNAEEGIYNILQQADFDLILMDYNLIGTNGSMIIEDIRNQELYTEIVFYSQSGAQMLREAIGSRGIDGVYCTSRQISEFEDKVFKVIKNTIKKVQDINNMRGLVIAEAIDLETRIKIILQKYFELDPNEVSLDEKRLKVYNGICEKKEIQNNQDNKFIALIPTLNFNNLIEKDYFLTSVNLFHGLQSALKEDLKEINLLLNSKLDTELKSNLELKKLGLITLKDELNNFETDIIKLRNTLAHVEEKVDHEGTHYLESLSKNGVSIKFTNEKYIEIRRSIHKHSENLNKIMELFIPNKLTAEAAPTSE
jgi:CheY-like chemotaxis protein